ncbi:MULTISPECIES: thioesterase family protein [Acidianus]|uniref:Thioesterase n=1 Tax=Candidatus Acidianus copahuensis TaxID=1160895 RepID=A0A031LQI4_9CREN|nr:MULTISPECIES: thioesterase family protein [Acidianus]EZQ10612.1 thioesterase [Candidatus Acidianus copahuensis]NON61599.1 acyl-CoA thioesterase [Acidianus sp. RZ1]
MSSPEFVFEETVRIYDTDTQGIAHYASYYRFFTNAIENYMKEKVGISYPIVNDNLWFVMVESQAIYKRPLRLGDQITVLLSPKALSKKVVRFDITIIKGGEKATEGYVVQASIDPKNWKAIEIPDELIEKITKV